MVRRLVAVDLRGVWDFSWLDYVPVVALVDWKWGLGLLAHSHVCRIDGLGVEAELWKHGLIAAVCDLRDAVYVEALVKLVSPVLLSNFLLNVGLLNVGVSP